MIILGSSGSIGLNALNLAKEYSLKVDALACKSSLKVLNAQIEEFSPKLVYIDDDSLKPLVNHKLKKKTMCVTIFRYIFLSAFTKTVKARG